MKLLWEILFGTLMSFPQRSMSSGTGNSSCHCYRQVGGGQEAEEEIGSRVHCLAPSQPPTSNSPPFSTFIILFGRNVV